MQWEWAGGRKPHQLLNWIPEYHVPVAAWQQYKTEIEKWITKGWLVPYDETKFGEPKGVIPLMAVIQRNRRKVWPVMDYWELNTHLETHTANTDIHAYRLREWRRMGRNVKLINLKKAYLQVRVHHSGWAYKTVIFRGERLCLTRLGFDLSIAPMVIKAVTSKVLKKAK